MIQNLQDLKIENLKGDCARLYYFGLGFIQLKLNEIERLHFYSPRIPAITEDVHNHRYGFISRILKGQLVNHLYRVDQYPQSFEDSAQKPILDYTVNNESCNPEIKTPRLSIPATALLENITTYIEGQSYVMTPTMFHRVETNGPTITHLIRGHKVSEMAQVVLPKYATPVCPFSQKIPENELWEIIEEMIKS